MKIFDKNGLTYVHQGGKQDEGKGSKTVIHALYAIGLRDKKVQKT